MDEAKVLNRLLEALDSYEFVFGQLKGVGGYHYVYGPSLRPLSSYIVGGWSIRRMGYTERRR